jgi:hypothetical protein
VKKVFWIFSLLTIAGLYSLVIDTYNSPEYVDQFGFSKNTNFENQYFSSLEAADLFCHPVQTVNYVTASNSLPLTSFKNPFKAFLAFVKAIENLYFNIFSQYRFYSQNELIRLKQIDLIFPFHYFW